MEISTVEENGVRFIEGVAGVATRWESLDIQVDLAVFMEQECVPTRSSA